LIGNCRRKAAVALLLSHSTTWRAIEMVLLNCFRQKQTVNKSIYFKNFYGNWTVFVKNKQQKYKG
jgi:hypothetical protein